MTDNEINTLHKALAEITQNPCASHSLQAYASAALKRDPVDVAEEIAFLFRAT